MIVILSKPQLPENIGFVARAMANFGVQELRLVSPRLSPTHEKALATATKAQAILVNSRLFSSLEDAISDCNEVFGTTSFEHDITQAYETPRSFANRIVPGFLSVTSSEPYKVAVVFGKESTGLSNNDLSLCRGLISIPVSSAHPSMNLSHAVTVVLYEWRMALTELPRLKTYVRLGNTYPAPQEKIHFFLDTLEKHLDRVGFWRTLSKKPVMKRNIWSMFQRMSLTAQDLRTLHGILDLLANPRSPSLASREDT